MTIDELGVAKSMKGRLRNGDWCCQGPYNLGTSYKRLSTMIKTNLSQILFAAAFTCLLVSGYLPPVPNRMLSILSGFLAVAAVVAWVRSDAAASRQ